MGGKGIAESENGVMLNNALYVLRTDADLLAKGEKKGSVGGKGISFLQGKTDVGLQGKRKRVREVNIADMISRGVGVANYESRNKGVLQPNVAYVKGAAFGISKTGMEKEKNYRAIAGGTGWKVSGKCGVLSVIKTSDARHVRSPPLFRIELDVKDAESTPDVPIKSGNVKTWF